MQLAASKDFHGRDQNDHGSLKKNQCRRSVDTHCRYHVGRGQIFVINHDKMRVYRQAC
jgi:hypothetical protein